VNPPHLPKQILMRGPDVLLLLFSSGKNTLSQSFPADPINDCMEVGPCAEGYPYKRPSYISHRFFVPSQP
jgi:hypothetical protein